MIVDILYEDDYLLAVDKPRNIHVHPTKFSRRERSLQDLLEEKYGRRFYPIHRLDRPVGGVLLFAKSSEAAGILGQALRNRDGMNKRYLCVVRGWMEGSGIVDRPMRQAPGKPEKEAITHWCVLGRTETPWSDGIFPTSRYSLVECTLETGRHHQIRRHLSSVSHPVMGDIAHGDNPRNRIWKAETGLDGLMLRAHRLGFLHPIAGEPVMLTAPPDRRFIEAANRFSWEEHLVVE